MLCVGTREALPRLARDTWQAYENLHFDRFLRAVGSVWRTLRGTGGGLAPVGQ